LGSSDVVRLRVGGTSGQLDVYQLSYYRLVKSAQTYVALSCDTDGVFDASYRFGFNGQMKDNEIAGTGNNLDFGARMYNPRLGRFFSVDPDSKMYPGWSPYVFAMDNPIRLIDAKGRGPKDAIKIINDVANQQANQLWSNATQPDGTVREGSLIVVTKSLTLFLSANQQVVKQTYTSNVRVSTNPGAVIIDHTVKDGETLVGDLHTHPYDKITEHGLQGIAFSAADISGLRHNANANYVSMIEAGDRRFALVITDEQKAKAFFNNNSNDAIQTAYNAAYTTSNNNPNSTNQEDVKNAVKATIGVDNGMELYESDSQKTKYTKQ
jgi:RHS repeat-associated protein